MNLKNQVAAFFDFDETLLEVESGRMGLQWLWDRRLLHLGYIIKVQAAHFFYRCWKPSAIRMSSNPPSFLKESPTKDPGRYFAIDNQNLSR